MQDMQQQPLIDNLPKITFWGKIYYWISFIGAFLIVLSFSLVLQFPVLAPSLIIAFTVWDLVLLVCDLFIKVVWLKKLELIFLIGCIQLIIAMMLILLPIITQVINGVIPNIQVLMLIEGIGGLIVYRRQVWDNWPVPSIKPKNESVVENAKPFEPHGYD